jgi:hypothetical protein
MIDFESRGSGFGRKMKEIKGGGQQWLVLSRLARLAPAVKQIVTLSRMAMAGCGTSNVVNGLEVRFIRGRQVHVGRCRESILDPTLFNPCHNCSRFCSFRGFRMQ